MNCSLDIETRSACDLQKAGGYHYSQHPSTIILCFAYKLGTQDAISVRGDAPVPQELIDHINSGGTMRAWNGISFDFLIFNRFHPECIIPPEQQDDVMDRARVVGIPAMLAKAAVFMRLKIHKDMPGHKLMLKLCKAENPEPTEDELQTLMEYCRTDVEVEAQLAERIPPLPAWEVPVMRLSHEINARGFMIDVQLAKRAVVFAAEEHEELCFRMSDLTDGQVTRHTQRAKLLKWLNDNGLKLPNIQKQTLEDTLNDSTLDTKVREAISIRLSGAKASTAKFKAALNAVDSDDRIRGSFTYFGAAATGRWSGRILQPHNLPRDTAEDPYQVLEDIERGRVPSVYKALSTLLRPMIIAPEGKSLVRCDFSAIEGRVVAWLANDKPALKEYRGEGKMYERAAAGIYGVPISKVTKVQRQVGKVAELALGFQGGHKAFEAMAKGYSVKVPTKVAKEIVKSWRSSRPAVVALWREVENAAVLAFRRKGHPIKCCGGKVTFILDAGTGSLWIHLPSSRFICLPEFKVNTYEGPYGTAERLTYKRGNWTPAADATEWPRSDTYGGSLVESLAQGIARDLMAEAMLKLDLVDDIVMHVHDEIVVEVEDIMAESCLADMEYKMSLNPTWAKDLPLAAVGEISKRFGK